MFIELFSMTNIPFISYFILLGLIISSKITEYCLRNFMKHELNEEKIIKTVIYILELLVNPFITIYFVRAYLGLYEKKPNFEKISKNLCMSCIFICSSYLFQMIYDRKMNKYLQFHHILTVLLVIINISWINDYPIIDIAKQMLQPFFIITEFTSFLLMLDYRLNLKFPILVRQSLIYYFGMSRLAIAGWIFSKFQEIKENNTVKHIKDTKFWIYFIILVVFNIFILLVQLYITFVYKKIILKKQNITSKTEIQQNEIRMQCNEYIQP